MKKNDKGYCSLLYLSMGLLAVASACVSGPSQTISSCEPGAYKNGEEIVVVYRRATDPANKARYTFVDGRRGELSRNAGEFSCRNNRYYAEAFIEFEEIKFTQTNDSFISDGTHIGARLITNEALANENRSVVVYVHGSEATPTVGWSPYPYLFAAQGVDVMVYDKRGTGKSSGTYTQNFQVLANDAAAAGNVARLKTSETTSRFGYHGASQGGWVAPLAASQTGADFVVIGYGLVLTPLEEDAEQVFEELRRHGYGPEAISRARMLTDATGIVVASGFKRGIDNLIQLRDTYSYQPWFDVIQGEFTGDLIRAPEAALRKGRAGDFEDTGTSWRHDAVGVLRGLEMEQLWIQAGSDRVAPGDVTKDRLLSLQKEGKPITLAIYPDTDHGIVEYVENEDGDRTYTRFSKGYLKLAADGIKGEWNPPYGRAEIYKAEAEEGK